MSEREWSPIETAPNDGNDILVAFQGQWKWVCYVAPAHGNGTGQHMPYAPPTHWMPLPVPPVGGMED